MGRESFSILYFTGFHQCQHSSAFRRQQYSSSFQGGYANGVARVLVVKQNGVGCRLLGKAKVAGTLA